MKFTVEPKEKPRWYQFREKLAFALVRLANKIKPKNDAAMSFWLQELVNDTMVNGTGMFKIIKPKNFWGEPKPLD